MSDEHRHFTMLLIGAFCCEFEKTTTAKRNDFMLCVSHVAVEKASGVALGLHVILARQQKLGFRTKIRVLKFITIRFSARVVVLGWYAHFPVK